METEQALRQEAAWIARSLQANAPRDGLSEIGMRLSAYRPKFDAINPTFQCPRCWIRDGLRKPLRCIPGTDDHDLLACEGCQAEFVVPL